MTLSELASPFAREGGIPDDEQTVASTGLPPSREHGSCASSDTLRSAAIDAGKGDVLAKFAADYPVGPHDQPQSMCPAFGSLRVGLRMRRTATILSGSACCVYGLTFTSHFYGAKRSVGYVPFSSETLVTGKLFEDIKDAVAELADPALYDVIVVTNLCVPTASGVPLHLLGKTVNGVRIIGIDVPGFGIPTHAEAKDVLAGAMLSYARREVEAGPVAAPRDRAALPTIALLGEMFYTASVREFEAAGRTVVGSAPVGVDGTAAWLDAIGHACGIAQAVVDAAKNQFLPAIRAALDAKPIAGRITVSGYEGSELLVARLLIESGAEVPYVGTALPRTVWSDPDRDWLVARGVHVQYRASLEHDLQAVDFYQPDLAIGTTPVVQHAKSKAVPSLYFTNLISARPLMGVAGAGSLAQVVTAAMGNRARFDTMKAFFEGVGVGPTAGVWEKLPVDRPEFKAKFATKRIAAAKAESAVGV